MKLKSIYIDGFRSLKDFKIDTLENINIFYGDNNTGKSNIINALELFFSDKEIEIEDIKTTHEFVGKINLKQSDFFKNQKEKIIFKLEIILDDMDIGELKEKTDKESLKLFKVFNKKNNILFLKAEIDAELEDKKKADFKLAEIKINNTNLRPASKKDDDYRPLEQIIRSYIFFKRFKKISTIRQIGKETYDTKKQFTAGDTNIQSYLFDLSHSPSKSKQILFREIEKSFSELHGKIGDLEFSLEFAGINKEKETGNAENIETHIETTVKEIKLNIFSEKSDLFIPIDNLGSGLKQTIILLSNIISNRSAKIFGIEELELNLSPENQKLIFEKLLEMKKKENSGFDQIFLTSHSPVFQNIKLENCKVFHVKIKNEITVAGKFKREERKLFFDPCQIPEYKIQFDIEKSLSELYKKHNIDENCKINNNSAIDFIDTYVMDEITKNKLFKNKEKIEDILNSVDKKINKEWKIVKTN